MNAEQAERDRRAKEIFDLSQWTVVTNYNGSDTPLVFTDPSVPEHAQRFYRARPGNPN